MEKKVDEYLTKNPDWQAELTLLRTLCTATDMTETYKWNAPVYTYEQKNIVGLGAFKSYVGLWFFQGALLRDRKNILINAQEGKTTALRQMRFRNKADIDIPAIEEYLEEAIENQKTGIRIKPVKSKPLVIPVILSELLTEDKRLNRNFRKLTLYRQKEYSDYISEAKKDATKLRRIQKIIPMINLGLGLNDKYRK